MQLDALDLDAALVAYCTETGSLALRALALAEIDAALAPMVDAQVRRFMQRHAKRYVDEHDLAQEGHAALIDAATGYEHRGSFVGYARKAVKGALFRAWCQASPAHVSQDAIDRARTGQLPADRARGVRAAQRPALSLSAETTAAGDEIPIDDTRLGVELHRTHVAESPFEFVQRRAAARFVAEAFRHLTPTEGHILFRRAQGYQLAELTGRKRWRARAAERLRCIERAALAKCRRYDPAVGAFEASEDAVRAKTPEAFKAAEAAYRRNCALVRYPSGPHVP